MSLDQPLDPSLHDSLAKAVKDGFAAQIALTQELVRRPSQRGEEHTVQDFVFAELRKRGYQMERFAMDREALAAHPGAGKWSPQHSEAPIVVGIHRPRNETGRSLILQGHVDVVPTGPAHMWSDPPYSATIRDGKMYGRGAGDMKSGLVCGIAALDALRALGWQPAATLYLQSVVEEESTGDGALMAHIRGYKADAALVPEPTGEAMVRANLGVIWFRVEFEGIPRHVSEMGEGANAIDAAIRTIAALRQLETAWNDRRGEHPLFADMPKPINLNVGRIEGGEWASSVPATAAVDFRISLLPNWDVKACAAEIEAHLKAFVSGDPYLSNNPPRLVWNGFMADGYEQPEGTEAEAVLARAHQAATGKPLPAVVLPAYIDTRIYALFDKIPTLCYGARNALSHGIDEYVEIDSLERVTLSIALFIAEWCGLEPVEA